MESISVKEFRDARSLIEKGILSDAINKADKRDISDLQRNVSESKEAIAMAIEPMFNVPCKRGDC
jgi:DNA-binding GntR family transcriptional regulator